MFDFCRSLSHAEAVDSEDGLCSNLGPADGVLCFSQITIHVYDKLFIQGQGPRLTTCLHAMRS